MGGGGGGVLFFIFLGSLCVPIMFIKTFQCVPILFSKFSMCCQKVSLITPNLKPMFFGQIPPLLTYIGGLKGEVLHLKWNIGFGPTQGKIQKKTCQKKKQYSKWGETLKKINFGDKLNFIPAFLFTKCLNYYYIYFHYSYLYEYYNYIPTLCIKC